jgi:hypothetical protein
MALRERLIHRGTIERRSTASDPAGADEFSFGPHLNGVHCRLIVKDERVALPGIGAMVLTTTKAVFLPGTDVRVGDRVTFTLEGGVTMGPFSVEEILPRTGLRGMNHLSLRLEKAA